MLWTAEEDACLRAKWGEGLSCSQIARFLNGGQPAHLRTRNMVIGRVHRLGISDRANPSRPGQANRGIPPQPRHQASRRKEEGKREKVQKIWPSRVRVVPMTLAKEAKVKLLPPIRLVPQPVPDKPGIAEIGPYGEACRWPYGDAGEAGFHFCGAKCEKDESPYCDAHRAVAYAPLPARKDNRPFMDLRKRRAA